MWLKKKHRIRRVIGLNTGHDGGCALVIDGKVVVAVSEDRLVRKKNSSGYLNSLRYCLEVAGLTLADIDLVVFSSYRERLPFQYDGGLGTFNFSKNKCINVDHHLSHACATFFTSPFNEASILVYDGHGNTNETESFYRASGTNIEKVAGNPFPDPMKGIVRAYEAFTNYFGWTSDEAGKTMGLASYGDPNKFSGHKLYSKTEDGFFYNNLEDFCASGVEIFCKKNGIQIPPKFSKNKFDDYVDMAAWIQHDFEEAVTESVSKLCQLTGYSNICLSGGGALNSVANNKILELPEVKDLFIFPAAGDTGQCVGNALYGYYIFGKNPRQDYVWRNDYIGKSYGNEEILKRLEGKRGFRENAVKEAPEYSFEVLDNVPRTVAELIAQGSIIGWHQGGAELGPRALGHRSILCDPRNKDMKEILNLKVKGRENFRPFAASVLKEESHKYFDLETPSPFMLLVTNVKKDKIAEIPSVVHVDGTCRAQTVTKEDNGIYYDLIKSFYELTGLPMILDTSFNLAGEPIVETPTDAMQCFLKTKMDYLVINNILIKKV